MAEEFNVGGKKLINMANGTNPQDAVAYSQVSGVITRKSLFGDIVQYKPSADTDVARGASLLAAIAEISTGDTLYINSGVYDVGNSGFLINESFNMVGFGQPVIQTLLPTGADKGGFTFTSDNEINISGVVFKTDVSDTEYGTGHVYNVISNNAGVVENCGFVFNITMTTIDATKRPKNYVNLADRNSKLTNCVFHTISTVAVGGYHGALHASGGPTGTEYKAFDGCFLLGENLTDIFLSPPQLINCRCNTKNKYNIPLLNLYSARAVVPVSSRTLLDESKYIKYAEGISPNEYAFGAKLETGTDVRTIFEIEASNDGYTVAQTSYEIEISGEFLLGGDARDPYYYHAIVQNGTVEVIKEYTTTALPAYIGMVHNVGASDTFNIQERTQGNTSFYGFVKFKPHRNPDTALNIGTAQHFDTQISFIDISE